MNACNPVPRVTTSARPRPATPAEVFDLGPSLEPLTISTPAADSGFFAELFQRCRAGEISEAASYQAPTSSNPMIDPVYLEAQRAALGPDDYDREFNAAFTSGSAAFIEPERVRECTQEWLEALPGDGREWVVSIDPSFSETPPRSPSSDAAGVIATASSWGIRGAGSLRRRGSRSGVLAPRTRPGSSMWFRRWLPYAVATAS